MAKIPEAMTRMYKNKYICKNCKSAIRADPLKINEGLVTCRTCQFNKFRAPRKK